MTDFPTDGTVPETTPVMCLGGFVHEDSVDGNFTVWCPTCGRRCEAYPIDNSYWFVVQGHRLIVHPDLGIHPPEETVS